MISTQQQKYIDMSIDLANQSSYRFRLGAVITAGGRIQGTGFSKYQNSPKQVADQHLKQCSVHAEIDALRGTTCDPKLPEILKVPLKRATIYIARLNKANEPVLAKPCSRCTTALLGSGITTFIWTVDSNNCGISRISEMRKTRSLYGSIATQDITI